MKTNKIFLYRYPVRLNLADFCTKKWRLSSSKILDRTPAMPAFFSSIFTIFYCTSYRPIQNVPGILLVCVLSLTGCDPTSGQSEVLNSPAPEIEKINKTDEQWKAELPEMTYYVMRQAGTERAFTGELLKNKKEGTYTCAACGLPLFSSGTKFKSGTGWPSFYQPIKEGYVLEKKDVSMGMARIEVVCARCDGHLGHVFNDGPKPTGLRYCLNSAALAFEEGEETP